MGEYGDVAERGAASPSRVTLEGGFEVSAAVAAKKDVSSIDEGVQCDDKTISTDACLICLGDIQDRTVLPACQHSLFCFECILRWIAIHRRCPLCSTAIGAYLIHEIRNETEYVRHRLPAICGTPQDQGRSSAVISDSRSRTEVVFAATQQRAQEQRLDALQRWQYQLSVRRRVYRQGLYCRHVGSNRRSRLAPPPSPSAIDETPSLRALLLRFIRRDLLAFPIANLDVEFTSTYAVNVFRTLEIKSDEAVTLLQDFLTSDGAQHFCHEVYCFVRFITAGAGSYPDKLAAFDEWATYDWPEQDLERRIVERAQSDKSESSLSAALSQKEQELKARLRSKLPRRRHGSDVQM